MQRRAARGSHAAAHVSPVAAPFVHALLLRKNGGGTTPGSKVGVPEFENEIRERCAARSLTRPMRHIAIASSPRFP
jgi:hypothetical protein